MSTHTHRTIIDALQYEYVNGVTADVHVRQLFERIRKVLAPDMPRLQYELLVADIRRDAEDALAWYVGFDPIKTADAIVEALDEAPAEPAER
jgi:hypothetical protein